MMTAIEKIRSEIDRDVFDYTQLMSVLQDYKKPRDTVTRLIEQRKIIRIKKGLYIFGELWKRSNYSLESLAGLIHGPSAISLDYALSWFGLIPERVYVVTSISTGRSRKFTTPIGDFSYRQLSHMRKLPVRKIANGGGKFPASAGGDGSNHVHPFRNQSEPRQGVIKTDGRRTMYQSGK